MCALRLSRHLDSSAVSDYHPNIRGNFCHEIASQTILGNTGKLRAMDKNQGLTRSCRTDFPRNCSTVAESVSSVVILNTWFYIYSTAEVLRTFSKKIIPDYNVSCFVIWLRKKKLRKILYKSNLLRFLHTTFIQFAYNKNFHEPLQAIFIANWHICANIFINFYWEHWLITFLELSQIFVLLLSCLSDSLSLSLNHKSADLSPWKCMLLISCHSRFTCSANF